MASLRQLSLKDAGWAEPGRVTQSSCSSVVSSEQPVLEQAEGQRLTGLIQAIEGEVIPRLVLAWRAASDLQTESQEGRWSPGEEDVTEFADLALNHEAPTASAYIKSLLANGATIESIYLELMAPAARYLGELWVADRCHFAEVTLGLCRLQQVMRECSPAFQMDAKEIRNWWRALLIAVPGEQHTFGVSMVAEFFRRSGWDVASDPVSSDAALSRLVSEEWFALAGLSLSAERWLGVLEECIHTIRRASRNKSIVVMVGGPFFVEHPEVAETVGADGTAVDGLEASVKAQSTVTLLGLGD